jgi:hypothetical protein
MFAQQNSASAVYCVRPCYAPGGRSFPSRTGLSNPHAFTPLPPMPPMPSFLADMLTSLESQVHQSKVSMRAVERMRWWRGCLSVGLKKSPLPRNKCPKLEEGGLEGNFHSQAMQDHVLSRRMSRMGDQRCCSHACGHGNGNVHLACASSARR